MPIPNYDRRAFREAVVKALVHRDYARLGAPHVRINDIELTISNPGGFVERVNLLNLLVTKPRPRNPLLADIAKRIGLAERTGRGIDRIFMGMLRYGRPAPDYSRSDALSAIVDTLKDHPAYFHTDAVRDNDKRNLACKAVRDKVVNALMPLDPQLTGDQALVMNHVLNLSFPGMDSEALVVELKDLIAISNGSACTSSIYTPSHVLKAMGMTTDDAANACVRISWCHMTPEVDWQIPAGRIKSML